MVVQTQPQDWSDQETLLLLEGLELHKDRWGDIADHVGSKSQVQCILHFLQLPIEDEFLDELEDRGRKPQGVQPGANAEGPDFIPFADTGNPILSQVVLSVLSHYRPGLYCRKVTAVGSCAALSCLSCLSVTHLQVTSSFLLSLHMIPHG